MLKSFFTRTASPHEKEANNNNTNNYIFPSVDPAVDGPDCSLDCADCTVKWPSRLKTDTSRNMYGGIKPFATHVLVATGKTDWIRKVENEEGSLMEAFKKGSVKGDNGRIMVSASNIPVDQNQDTPSGGSTVLILPSFTFVDAVTPSSIPEFTSRFINTSNSTIPPEKNTLKSRPCTRDCIILLCSHRTRDARCGISAPLIKQELERHLRPLGLLRDNDDDTRPGGVGIYFVSHTGGHKFAANVLVYRKKEEQLIWLARVRPQHCEGIVRFTVLEGKVVEPGTRLRGGFDRKRGLTSW